VGANLTRPRSRARHGICPMRGIEGVMDVFQVWQPEGEAPRWISASAAGAHDPSLRSGAAAPGVLLERAFEGQRPVRPAANLPAKAPPQGVASRIEVLTAGPRRVAHGEAVGAVAREFYPEVRRAIEQDLGRGVGADEPQRPAAKSEGSVAAKAAAAEQPPAVETSKDVNQARDRWIGVPGIALLPYAAMQLN
jgi:hypothetical protein